MRVTYLRNLASGCQLFILLKINSINFHMLYSYSLPAKTGSYYVILESMKSNVKRRCLGTYERKAAAD